MPSLPAWCWPDAAATTSRDEPEAQQIAGGTSLDSTWPLTGLPVTGDGSAAQIAPGDRDQDRQHLLQRPQLGLGSADLVVEELVEGGMTRLAVFHYSEIPDEVGPVRSMRASDIGIVSPVEASVVTSGAAGQTIDRIHGAGIKYFGEGSKGVYRDDSRSAPYNLFANLNEVADNIKQADEKRPDDYLPVGRGQGPSQGSEGEHDRGLLREPHHELDVPERQLRQPEHLRRVR